MAFCDASVAGAAWGPAGVPMVPKLVQEGKQVQPEYGHVVIMTAHSFSFSFWVENLFITVTAFSLHGSISVVAA